MADVTDSKSVGGNTVWVQVPPSAPNQYNPNPVILQIGDGFGLFVVFGNSEDEFFRNGVRKGASSKPRGPKKKKQSAIS